MDTQITRICAGVNVSQELFLKYGTDELIKIRSKKFQKRIYLQVQMNNKIG